MRGRARACETAHYLNDALILSYTRDGIMILCDKTPVAVQIFSGGGAERPLLPRAESGQEN